MKININRATKVELQQLNGIGPVRAKAIIDFRNKKRFRDIYELSQIRGLGRKTMDSLISKIEV